MAEYINETEVLQRALDTYGSTLQIAMVFEEMSELQKELCKYLRGRGWFEHIAEELADVENMTVQLRIIYDEDGMVDYWKQAKMNRLAHRMDGDAKC